MLRGLLLACGTLLIPSIAFAVPLGSAPVASILVLPFTVPGGGDAQWMGKAVQQDLMADLSQGTHAIVWAPSSAPAAADDAAALATARERGAALVVYGQAQTAGKELRLTGQVLDVATGKPLGNLKATGSSEGLFSLEDAVAGQVFAVLPAGMLDAKALQAGQQPPAAGDAASEPAQAPPATQGPADTAPATTPAPYTPPQWFDSYPPTTTYTYTYYQPVPVYNYVYTYPLYTRTYCDFYRPYCDFYRPCYDFFTPCYPQSSFFIGFDVGRFHEHHHDFVHARSGREGPSHQDWRPDSHRQEDARPGSGHGFVVGHSSEGRYTDRPHQEAAAPTPRVTHIRTERAAANVAVRESGDRASYSSSRSDSGSPRMSVNSRSSVSVDRFGGSRSESPSGPSAARSSEGGGSRGGAAQSSAANHSGSASGSGRR